MRAFFCSLVVVALLSGCAFGYPGLRDTNSKGLSSLNLGMTKVEVVAIMGTKGFGQIDNPARREQFMMNNDVYEVLYYYTTFIQDGQPMDTGYTPVIFKNGHFIGSGREFLTKIR